MDRTYAKYTHLEILKFVINKQKQKQEKFGQALTESPLALERYMV